MPATVHAVVLQMPPAVSAAKLVAWVNDFYSPHYLCAYAVPLQGNTQTEGVAFNFGAESHFSLASFARDITAAVDMLAHDKADA